MKNEKQEILVGMIGLGLSAGLWLLSSWRLVFHTLFRREQEQLQELPIEESEARRSSQPSLQSSSTTKWLTRRRTFHALLWLATSFEAVAYADLSTVLRFSSNRVYAEKIGYILLDVVGRSVFELLSFCTLTGIWLHTAIKSSPTMDVSRHRYRLLTPVFVFVTVLLVLASATLSVVIFVLFGDDTLDRIQTLPLSQIQTLLEAFAWGLNSLVVMECLIITSRRITALVTALEWKKRLFLLSKAVLPMLVASLVYGSRCVWLVIVYFHSSSLRGTWAWWIGFMWCPTLMAVIVSLYSARKRDQHPQSDELQQPLLAPPTEAFQAFSMHRNGGDLDDSLCRSPMFHVFAPREGGLEVADEETLSTDSLPTPATEPN